MKITLLTFALLSLAACSGPRTHVTEQDEFGHYRTTSDYQAMDRSAFMTAMEEGLENYEGDLAELRRRANELGGDALKKFSDYNEKLEKQRLTFENELQRTRAALVDDWPRQRDNTIRAYYELRDTLDKAHKEVLEEV